MIPVGFKPPITVRLQLGFSAPSGRSETGNRADHVTMAQGHHLLEGAIANASPEASQARRGSPKTIC